MSSNALIAKSTSWSFAGKLASKFFAFIYTVIIAHILIPEEIGTFYLAVSIVNIIFIFTDLGIYNSLIRYIPYLYGKEEYGKLRDMVKIGYVGGGGMTLLFTAGVFIFSSDIATLINAPEIEPALQILSLFLILKELFIVTRGTLTGRKRIKDSHTLEVLQNFFKMAITIPIIYIVGQTSVSLSLGFVISFAMIMPLGFYWVWKEVRSWPTSTKENKYENKINFIREVIQFGIAISLVGAMWAFIQYSDRVMLGYFDVSMSDIGVYSIVFGLISLIIIFPSSVTSIAKPLIAEFHGMGEKKNIMKIISTTFDWTIILMMPIVIVLLAFSEFLLNVFYGNEYTTGKTALIIISLGVFFNYSFIICKGALAAMGKLKIQIKCAFIAAALNVGLNVFLIPEYGIEGAAFASMISMAVFSACIYKYSHNILGFKLTRKSLKILGMGVLSLLIILLVKPYILTFTDHAKNFFSAEILSQSLGMTIVEKILQLGVFGVIFLITTGVLLLLLIMSKCFGNEESELLIKALRRMRVPEKWLDKLESIIN
jgi:O-antigen/teichoic acid export membrane protein